MGARISPDATISHGCARVRSHRARSGKRLERRLLLDPEGVCVSGRHKVLVFEQNEAEIKLLDSCVGGTWLHGLPIACSHVHTHMCCGGSAALCVFRAVNLAAW